jgi:hypothetical protein
MSDCDKKIKRHVINYLERSGPTEQTKLFNSVYFTYNELIPASVILDLKLNKVVKIEENIWELN